MSDSTTAKQRLHWEKLQRHYPTVAERLREATSSPGLDPGDMVESASRIWQLSQVYLIWLEDDGTAHDTDIVRTMWELSRKPPRCSVEEEAGQWLLMFCLGMSDLELELAIGCAVVDLGPAHVLSGAADDNLRELIHHCNTHSPRRNGG